MEAYFFISKKRVNRRGECPVYCRIKSEKERADFSTGIFISPDIWAVNQWRTIAEKRVGDRLNTIYEKVYRIISDLEHEEIYAPMEVLQVYREGRRRLIRIDDIAEEFIRKMDPPFRVIARMRTAVEQFMGQTKTTAMAKVTAEVLERFEKTSLAKDMAVYTIFKKLQLLKRLFRFAQALNYIKTNPFELYKLPRIPRPVLIQLSQPELALLQYYEFKQERLNRVKDLFLFQCYTGLSYCDLWSFGPGSQIQLHGLQFIKGTRKKTGEQYTIPFLPGARSIADKYDYKLPYLCNQKYNSYLKEITDILGIDKKLTTHTGRKTFAQIMLDSGYSKEAITRMMGHTSFVMTERHYARIGDERVAGEVMRMAG